MRDWGWRRSPDGLRSSRAESRDTWSIRREALSGAGTGDELTRSLSTPLAANGSTSINPLLLINLREVKSP